MATRRRAAEFTVVQVQLLTPARARAKPPTADASQEFTGSYWSRVKLFGSVACKGCLLMV